VNPTVTYELAVLRPDELRREADRHRLAASIRDPNPHPWPKPLLSRHF
jgi:hypothetical protein